MTGFMLALLGAKAMVQGPFVSAGGFSIMIIGECSALFVAILYVSFVSAYPASFRCKVVGLLFGVPILNAVNIIRIAGIFLGGVKFPSLFHYVHAYFGQVVLLAAVCVLCLFWLNFVVGEGKNNAPFGFLIRFMGFLSILFLPWMALHPKLVWICDEAMEFAFSLLGLPVEMFRQSNLHYQAFSLVGFTALILATTVIEKKKKTLVLISGWVILSTLHLLLNACVVLAVNYRMESIVEIANGVNILAQYLLPFAMWLALPFLLRTNARFTKR
jgi:exosortase/archaeosortase family protein